MSAERPPRKQMSILARLLRGIVWLAICWPAMTVGLGLIGIGAGLYLSHTRLEYRTSRAALLNEHEDYHRRWLRYVAEFGDQEDVVVVVQGQSRQAIVPALDDMVRELSAQPQYFQAILHKIDLTKLREKGLYYLGFDELHTIEGFLKDVEPIIHGGWQYLSPGAMASGMVAQLGQASQAKPEQLQQSIGAAQVKVAEIAESLLTALSAPGNYRSPWPELSGSATPLMNLTSHRLIIGDDRIGLVLLKLTEDHSQNFIRNADAVAALRATIERVKNSFPQVSIGLTGIPIMEHDEMQRSESSMTTTTLLSFAGVFLVLIAGLGGLRHSLLPLCSLLMGLLWALGYTTLVVGHLNILSSAFGAVLVGLGINYGIYFVARYLQLRKSHCTIEEAVLETAESVGPGIAISALASAISFLVVGLTEFAGVAELGLIAGGGIILCLIAAFTVLPALLCIVDRLVPNLPLPQPLDFHLWTKPFVARPVLTLITGVTVTTAVAFFGISRLHYDYNLLHLEPAGLECVELEEKLLAESKESVYFALSLAKSPQEAAERKAKFLALPCVDRVDEIATRFPLDMDKKRPVIEQIFSRLTGLPDRPPQIPVASPAELGQMLTTVQPLMSANLQMAKFQQQLQEIGSLLGRLPPDEYYKRLSQYQQHMAGDLLGRLHLLQSVANPEPPRPTDLPDGLVSRFVGRNGSHLLRIYVKGDFWDIDNMRQFVERVRSVDPDATGNPIQIYEASRQLKQSYIHAAIYALIFIVPVVFLTFGNLPCTLMAGIPVIADMLQMFGFMGLLGIPLNSANMIGISLMMGMGMENGLLITQDSLTQRGRYRMSASTGAAVMLNTLTTMIGFAVLILADHRGLQSLGRMLTIGMTCSLGNSLLFLHSWLVLVTRNRKDDDELEVSSTAGADLEKRDRRRFSETHLTGIPTPLTQPVPSVSPTQPAPPRTIPPTPPRTTPRHLSLPGE